jgi:hypothetical protein
MAHSTDPPKNIGELIDQIERIREELLTIQRSMENMEPREASLPRDGKKLPCLATETRIVNL